MAEAPTPEPAGERAVVDALARRVDACGLARVWPPPGPRRDQHDAHQMALRIR